MNTKLSTNYIANLIQIQSEIQINNKHNKEKWTHEQIHFEKKQVIV